MVQSFSWSTQSTTSTPTGSDIGNQPAMSVSQEETLLHAHTIPISLPISNPSRPEVGRNRAWNERTVKLTPNYGFLRPMKLEAGSIGGFKLRPDRMLPIWQRKASSGSDLDKPAPRLALLTTQNGVFGHHWLPPARSSPLRANVVEADSMIAAAITAIIVAYA